MEQLDLLWNYQEIDLKIDEIINQSKRSQNTLKLLKLRKFMMDKQDKLVELDREVNKQNKEFSKIKNICKLFSAEIEKSNDKLKALDNVSLKQIEHLETKCFQLKNKLKKKRNEMQKLVKRIDDLCDEAHKLTLEIKKAKSEYSEIKKDYDQEQLVFKKEANQIKKQRDEIGVQINQDLLKKYKNLKVNHSTAIAKIDHSRCGGCNMSLAALVIQNVKKQKKIIECENCGRILFIEE